MDSPMSTSTEVSEVSGSSPAHSTASSSAGGGVGGSGGCTSVTAAPGNNGGAIQKRFKMQNSGFNGSNSSHSANASPSKNGLSLNIKPSWAPLASLNGSTASLDRTTTTSHVSGAMSHNQAEAVQQPLKNSSAASELLNCPLCEHKCRDPSKLEEHVNRVHFDPESPAASAASISTDSTSSRGQKRQQPLQQQQHQKNLNNDVTPSSLPCPLCTVYYATSLELERHVNRDHSDVLSPMTTKRRPSLRDLVQANDATASSPTPSTTSSSASLRQLTAATNNTGGGLGGSDAPHTATSNTLSPSDGNGNQECPVCNVAGFQNQNQLAEHIDSHFNEKKNTVSNFAPTYL